METQVGAQVAHKQGEAQGVGLEVPQCSAHSKWRIVEEALEVLQR